MNNLLSTAKQILIEGAITLYNDRRTDLDDDALSYQTHYRNMGELIFQVDSYKSLGDILNDMQNDNLQELGYYGVDDDLIEEFLQEVLKNK
jgi:hypothetical protein